MEDNKNQNNKITPPVKPSLPSGVKFTNTVLSKPITKLEKSSEIKNTTIVKQEKINKKTTTPTSTKVKVITFIVSIVLVLSLLTSLVYFAFIKPTLPANININFTADQEFIFDESEGKTNENVMPGDNIDLNYVIKSQPIEGEAVGDVYVRLSTYAMCENNWYNDFFDIYFKDNNWYLGNDGFYYYKGVLSPNTSIDAVKYIHISDSIGREFAGKTVHIHIVSEALQVGNGAIESMWKTAPEEWTNMVL